MTTKDYKNILKSFNTADFGEYSAELFEKGNIYRKPTSYPNKTHPRLFFTKKTIGAVRKNLSAEENKEALRVYTELSEKEWDGRYTHEYKADDSDYCYFEDHADIMHAKAFRYAMTGEEKYGYEALIAAKNAILTINLNHKISDYCRRYGYIMWAVAGVYDWCYDLMSEEDKRQIIAGCVNLIGANFEVCNRVYEGNKLPVGQGAIFGHGAEDQILVHYLSFAIAVWGDASEIFELVGGRILNDFVDAQNFMMQSGSHWEGSMYSGGRTSAILNACILLNKMNDNNFSPFSTKLEDLVITASNYIRPDGQIYRIGDVNQNRTYSEGFQLCGLACNGIFAGNFYKNSYLKSIGYKYFGGFTDFSNLNGGPSPIQFLALNDPKVPYTFKGKLPLTHRTYFPLTNIFAKSAHNDKDAFGIYMTMPETCTTSHAHMECGSFQIYYKGSLASDSGAYDTWGGSQHFGYAMQTISSNSVLVYNPAFKDLKLPNRENMIYSGGQSIRKSCYLNDSIEGLIHHPSLGQCRSIGVENCEKNGEYIYSYMAGNMTGAYDDETVDEVTRYMFAFRTDNKKCPYAFMTFDRITAKDKSFRKAALIHTLEEPKIDGEFAIITDTRKDNSGKMVVQTVGEKTEYTVIGGEGRDHWIPGVDENGNYSLEAGKNLPTVHKIKPDSMQEYGWGRIEISPKNHEKTNTLLTVMYVTDTKNSDEHIKAEAIASDTLIGAEIFGKAVIFPKNESLLRDGMTFTLKKDSECYILGAKSREWKLADSENAVITAKVDPGKYVLKVSLKAGTYTLN